MKILFYSTKPFEQPYLKNACTKKEEAVFIKESLTIQTVNKANGYNAICVFTADDASAKVIEELYKNGVRFIAIRAAGYDNVDLQKANELGIAVANVPEYSPYAVAEHALALILLLNRKIIIADKQVHNKNFAIDNLIGFDLNGKTIGIIGTGKIGRVFVKMMHGFGCRLLAYDINEDKGLSEKYGVEYVDLPALCRQANIISLHTCLTPSTKYIINSKTIGLMQHGTMLINTSRGLCVNTEDVIKAIEKGQIGYFGTDVYENEKNIFFYNHSGKEINDKMLNKLLAMTNVIITPHQAFATQEALTNIANTTFYNIDCWKKNKMPVTELTVVHQPENITNIYEEIY